MAKNDVAALELQNTATPVEPNESYTPTSFIFAGEPRSMGGDIDEAPVTVESENI